MYKAIYRGLHVPPFIKGRGPTLYGVEVFNHLNSNQWHPAHPPKDLWLECFEETDLETKFRTLRKQWENCWSYSMDFVVSFVRIFEGIFWLFCLSRPWDFRSLNFVLSMDLKFFGPDLCVVFNM